MHNSEQKLNSIKNEVNEIVKEKQLQTTPQIIVVTKKFSLDKIIPLLKMGHLHFGENQIQEAEEKWDGIKNQYKNVKLHMLGKLQSNKVKKAVQIFDYIHSLDNLKLAKKISICEKEFNKKTKLFVQVNVGHENQKSGILPEQLLEFYSSCTKIFSLNVVGLMCIPPINSNPEKYFQILKKNSTKLNLPDLSMGMSSDYGEATIYGSTYLRLGTAILGKRNN